MPSAAQSKSISILIIGDLLAYIVSLVLTLAIRYGEIPSRHLLANHVPAFSILCVIFVLINFSAGLYDRHAAFIRGRIQGLLIKVQIINGVIGVMFFYFAPLTIAPKANLLIYFIISTALLFIWRIVMFPVVSITRRQTAILVGSGNDITDLHDEINGNSRYSLLFKEHILPGKSVDETVKAIGEAVKRTGVSLIVADLHDSSIESAMPFLYSLIFSGVQVIDAGKFYEAIFGRVPLSLVGERWLVEHSSTALGTRRIYDTVKRIIDIITSFIGGIISLVFYPFIYVAIRLEDHGPLFITQDRISRNGKKVKIIKFRSMTGNDQGSYGGNGVTKNIITKVGSFLRKSRLDELPQFWNVFRGDLSLVGPRPELPALVSVYEKKIPYYNARHLVKPGLFGWAQIYHETHPHHEVATEETRNKLSYDLYYIKNRSLALDLRIIMRTLQILISRTGR